MNSVFRRTSAAISQTTYRKVTQGAADQMGIRGKKDAFQCIKNIKRSAFSLNVKLKSKKQTEMQQWLTETWKSKRDHDDS